MLPLFSEPILSDLVRSGTLTWAFLRPAWNDADALNRLGFCEETRCTMFCEYLICVISKTSTSASLIISCLVASFLKIVRNWRKCSHKKLLNAFSLEIGKVKFLVQKEFNGLSFGLVLTRIFPRRCLRHDRKKMSVFPNWRGKAVCVQRNGTLAYLNCELSNRFSNWTPPTKREV